MSRFDTRAVLAVLAIAGAMIYQVLVLLATGDAKIEIPAWMAAVVMAAMTFYFAHRDRNGSEGGH